MDRPEYGPDEQDGGGLAERDWPTTGPRLASGFWFQPLGLGA